MPTKLILIILLPFLVIVLASSFAIEVVFGALTDNTTAYWKLDESSGDAADSTGNSRTLTNNSTVPYVAGLLGNAASFTDSAGDSLNRADIVGTTAGGAITIAAWVKITNAPSLDEVYTIASVAAGATAPYVANILYYRDSGGTKQLDFNRQRMAVANADMTYDVDLGTGTYHHIVATYDTTNATIYLDGAQVKQEARSGDGAEHGGANETVIGALHAAQNQEMDGDIDEVGIWSRALTQQEITDLYNAGVGCSYDFNCAATTVPGTVQINNGSININSGSLVL